MSNSNLFGATKQAVFLDRDGTINVEKEYLFRPEDFEFTPGAVEAIKILNHAGYLVIVVTNQSGVARGYYKESDVLHLHKYIDNLLNARGARVDSWYYCPHHPNGIDPYNEICNCRKPMPGMLLQAAAEHSIQLSKSWMVGDKIADIEAGMAAGCRPLLVLTGYGSEIVNELPSDIPVCQNLMTAAMLITSV